MHPVSRRWNGRGAGRRHPLVATRSASWSLGPAEWFEQMRPARPRFCRDASPGPARAMAREGGGPPARGTTLQPPTRGVRGEELARIEAVMFLAREPLPVRRIARLARLPDGTRARSLLRELDVFYDVDGSPFRIEQVAGGFQILTHQAFGPWLRRLLDAHSQNRLSAAAMETLAVIAYRQPVSRASVEAIRGVGCEDMIRQLLDRDLVAVCGRSEDIGRPHLYGTTRQFLRVFGLSRLEDLPPVAGVDPQSADPGQPT